MRRNVVNCAENVNLTIGVAQLRKCVIMYLVDSRSDAKQRSRGKKESL